MADRGHNGHAWRTLRALILGPEFLVCGICYQPIDKTLRWPHPWSKTVDLITPWVRGGDPLDPDNLRPAHLRCNTSRGAGGRPRRRWTTSVHREGWTQVTHVHRDPTTTTTPSDRAWVTQCDP